jgi:subtilase family serine protease
MAQRFAPTVRLVNRIDESNRVTLPGNTHPAANARNDRGQVSADLPMTDMILVLSRDPAQQAAFEKFVASQYDSTSPNYHHWLTPEEVGENFGPSQTDIETVKSWLTGQGFTVDQVTKDRMSIRFSGKASQVQSAFHTEIHNLEVKGVQHIGNMSDPQIPAALTPVVVGVKSLHNFFPRPLHRMGSLVQRDAATGKWKRGVAGTATASISGSGGGGGSTGVQPLFGINVPANSTTGSIPYTVEDISPSDFATIYNVLPLWNAGIDGTGQTIAIAGTSDIEVGQSGLANGYNDIGSFRSFFGLPTSSPANTPIRISGNSQPLTVCTGSNSSFPYPTAPCTIDDLIENSLDVEWSGAVAKNAQIVLVASYPASASDDNLYDSESYIVNNLTARIMNVSYGECELGEGTAGNVEYYNLWQTAASEGIAVFVAAGDSGSAGCDGGSGNVAEYGLSVSGLASTPYNTAVGGTDFNWCPLTTIYTAQSTSGTPPVCSPAPYWSSSNASNKGSALGYVPEVPWNDTCASSLALPYLQDWAGNSIFGVSGVVDAETACNFANFYYYGPVNNSFNFFYLVDTVGGSGGASGCVVNTSTSTTTGTCTTGATSTGSVTIPNGTVVGSINLTNNGWQKPIWQQSKTNNIPGLPNDGVRDIPDVSFFAAPGTLSESAYLICVQANGGQPCTYAADEEPFASEVGGTSASSPIMAGVMALINQKAGAAQGNPNAELYKLAAQQTYSGCSAESVKANSTSCYFNDIDTGTNAVPCDYGAVSSISPNCTATEKLGGYSDTVGILTGYSAGVGYDLATGLGSLNVANVVNAWPSIQGSAAATVTVTPGQTSINSNNTLSVTVTVASTAAGGVTPTGIVTLTGGIFNGQGTLSSSGSYIFTLPAYSLGAGTDTLTANYNGDAVYGAASNTAQVTVTTVVALTPTVTVTPASNTVDSNSSLNVTATVSGTGVTPTGTVTLSGGGLNPSLVGTLSGGSYMFTIPAGSLTAGGDTLTVTYSGDANYSSGSNTANVTVTASTFSLTQTPIVVTPSTIAPGASATATVTVAGTGGYSGTVTLTCQLQSTTAVGGDGATCTGGGSPGVNLSAANPVAPTVVFTVGTTAPVAELRYPDVRGKGRGWMGAGGGAVLALLVFLGIPARRRSWRQMLGMVVLMAALGSLSACGGGSSGGGGGGGQSDPGTTAGTYTFLVQGTGNPSVTPAVSTTFTVTVN